MIFVGTIEKQDGKLSIAYDLHEKLEIHLIKLKEGCRVTNNVRKYHKPRTTKQMGYFFGYVLRLTAAWMKYSRHETDQCYLSLKSMFLEDHDDTGRKYVRSLKWDSDDPVDTRAMNDFIDQVRDMVSMEYGYHIADPDKYNLVDVGELVTEIERSGV